MQFLDLKLCIPSYYLKLKDLKIIDNIEYTLIKEVPDVYTAKLNAHGIVEIYFSNKTNKVDKAHLITLKQTIFEIGKGKKMPVFFYTNDNLEITPEARKYAATEEAGEYTLANAILVKSLVNKILFNFFININKPIIVTKGFNTKQEAFEWLNNLNNTNDK